MLYAPFPFNKCCRCGQYFLPTFQYFVRNSSAKYKLGSTCKHCHRIRGNQWQENNPDRIKEITKRYRTNSREKSKARLKRYVDSHKDTLRIKAKDYYSRTIPYRRITSNKYRKNHPETARRNSQKRRARKLNVPNTFTEDEWKRALSYFKGTCSYCGNPPSLRDNSYNLHQDHFIPLTQSGGYVATNIVPACASCNFEKTNKFPDVWIRQRFGPRKAKTVLRRIQEYFNWVEKQK